LTATDGFFSKWGSENFIARRTKKSGCWFA
jgi:hypothetical protein